MATRQQRISDARSCAEMAQRMPPQGGLVCLPALYNSRLHVSSGGVIAYGVGLQTPMGRGLNGIMARRMKRFLVSDLTEGKTARSRTPFENAHCS